MSKDPGAQEQVQNVARTTGRRCSPVKDALLRLVLPLGVGEHLSNEQCQAKDFWLKKCNLLIESRWGPWVPEEWEPRIQRVSDLSLNYVGWPELRVLHWGPLNIFIWFIDDHWIIYSASWIWFYLDKAYYLHHFTSNIQSPLKKVRYCLAGEQGCSNMEWELRWYYQLLIVT